MKKERRRLERTPVGFYAHQVVDNDLQRWFAADLSAIGLFMERPLTPFARRSTVVQVEVPLPGTGDSLWARGEIVHDRLGSLFHGTGVLFTAMARRHQRWLREWLRETRRASHRARHRRPPATLRGWPTSLGIVPLQGSQPRLVGYAAGSEEVVRAA